MNIDDIIYEFQENPKWCREGTSFVYNNNYRSNYPSRFAELEVPDLYTYTDLVFENASNDCFKTPTIYKTKSFKCLCQPKKRSFFYGKPNRSRIAKYFILSADQNIISKSDYEHMERTFKRANVTDEAIYTEVIPFDKIDESKSVDTDLWNQAFNDVKLMFDIHHATAKLIHPYDIKDTPDLP
ncbi:hypothetical protein GJ496_004569 [Pomphorhynchus laevis]|nr:hypothetical protein GJ496_004569 [Pomphorhynchus laevis]